MELIGCEINRIHNNQEMPCQTTNETNRRSHVFEDHRFPILEHLRHHYLLAEQTQLKTNMAEINFVRKTKSNSTLLTTLAKGIEPIKIDVISIVYKRQLLQDLLDNNIDFDHYRSNSGLRNHIVAQRISTLNDRYKIPIYKQIHIHDCDFVQYKLKTLSYLTQHIHAACPHPLYLFYNIDETVIKGFEVYISDIKRGAADTRMDYEDILHKVV